MRLTPERLSNECCVGGGWAEYRLSAGWPRNICRARRQLYGWQGRNRGFGEARVGLGPSVTALSTVGLLPDSARVTGSVRYLGQEMVRASQAQLRRVRGNDISFIFQGADDQPEPFAHD